MSDIWYSWVMVVYLYAWDSYFSYLNERIWDVSLKKDDSNMECSSLTFLELPCVSIGIGRCRAKGEVQNMCNQNKERYIVVNLYKKITRFNGCRCIIYPIEALNMIMQHNFWKDKLNYCVIKLIQAI